jgi:hypothetical protein
VWNELIVLLAGPLAEYRVQRKSSVGSLRFYKFCMAGGYDPHGDASQAKKLFDWLVEHRFSPSIDAAWDRAEGQTKDLFRTQWKAIHTVAQLLIEKRRLDGPELLGAVKDLRTGYTAKEHRERSKAGCDVHLAKPADLKQLLALVAD